jgi:drug/metabolite transporter (DMT)-like permease
MQIIPLEGNQLALTLALMSNIFFGLSCLVFANFTARLGALWVNYLKAIVSTLCFFLLLLFLDFQFIEKINFNALLFFLSGALGLALADIFLLTSLRHNGVGETLVFYSFQPFLVYVFSYVLWDERLEQSQWVGVFVFCLCLIIFCLEKFKKSKVHLQYALMALMAIILDTAGVLITKVAYINDANISSVEACLYRGFGAITALSLIGIFRPFAFIQGFKSLNLNSKSLIIGACFTGTFLSLLFYLKAVQIGSITLLTAVSVATPLWATFFEFFYYKKLPSKVFIICFILYLSAFLWNFFQLR